MTGSGWEETLGVSRAHTLATDQRPSPSDIRQPTSERGGDVRAPAHERPRRPGTAVRPG